jgi:carbon starvation protein CstA
MIKLNKVDQEILGILRVVFLTRKVNPMQSDDHMRLWIIRTFFVLSVFGILTRIVIGISDQEISAEISAFFNIPIAFFFGVMFLHINNELEDTSLIVFVLTWLSIIIGLYV